VEEVYWGAHFHVLLVSEGVPLLWCCLHPARDTLQGHWQAFPEISLSAISKWVNPFKFRVAIDCTIAQNRHSDPPSLRILNNQMRGAIQESSILLNHPVKSISPPEPSVLLACSLSTQCQWNVHSTLVSEPVVFHGQGLILTSVSNGSVFLTSANIAVSRKPGTGRFGLGLWQTVPSIKSMNIDHDIRCFVYTICSVRQRILLWPPIFDIFNTQQAALKLSPFLPQKRGFWATACGGLKISKIGHCQKMGRAEQHILCTKR